MFCSRCGVQVKNDSRFCWNCGNALVSPEAPPRVEEPIPTPQEWRDAYSLFNYPYPFNYDYDYVADDESNGVPFRSYLIPNVLTTLFCCLPFGILGIFQSTLAIDRLHKGNFPEAWVRSRFARTLFWLGLILGAINLGYLIYSAVHNPASLETWRTSASGAFK